MNDIKIFEYEGSPITFNNGDTMMVNATEMAKPFGKRPVDWLKTGSSQDFIAALAEVKICTTEDLVTTTRGGNDKELQGTWMHEDVALEFARWLSPKFSIWCNDRIKELMKYGMTATPQTIDSILADPANAIKLLTTIQEEREAKEKALQELSLKQKQIEVLGEELIEKTIDSRQLQNIVKNTTRPFLLTQIAADWGMQANKLNKILHEEGVVKKVGGHWQLTAKYSNGTVIYGYSRPKFSDKNPDKILYYEDLWTMDGYNLIHKIMTKRGFKTITEQLEQ